jgi:hypothetical protein
VRASFAVAGVVGLEPVLGEPWIGGVGARLGCVEVGEVGGNPAAELGVIADVAVAGHHQPDALGAREQFKGRPVGAER